MTKAEFKDAVTAEIALMHRCLLRESDPFVFHIAMGQLVRRVMDEEFSGEVYGATSAAYRESPDRPPALLAEDDTESLPELPVYPSRARR